MSPLFSIVIPTFNSKTYSGECVRTALAQTYSNIEVVVDDNASRDGTCDLLRKEFGHDPRLKLFANSEDLNIPLGWSRAMRNATGDYLLLLHSDNVLHPRFVETAAKALEKFPASVLYAECLYYEGETPKDLFDSVDPSRPFPISFLGHGSRAVDYLFRFQRMIPTSAVFIAKKCFEQRAAYDAKYKWDPDIEQMIWLAERYDVLHLNLPLAAIRTHGGQAASWKDPSFSVQYNELLRMTNQHAKSEAHQLLLVAAYSNQDVCEKLGKLKGVKFKAYGGYLWKWFKAELSVLGYFKLQFARKVSLMIRYTLNWIRHH